MTILRSKQDNSINYVTQALQGFIESRFVERSTHYIGYISSQTGCNKGCRFCHLTATKQTKFEDVTPAGFQLQTENVIKGLIENKKPTKNLFHFNFMARGEVLANKYILANANEILFEMGKEVIKTPGMEQLFVRYNMSTIMPRNLDYSLTEVFSLIHPTIYYSFYSANPDFRKKWIPQAMDLSESLRLLQDYQRLSKKTLKIHHCFIEGENDSIEDVQEMCKLVKDYNLGIEFNLVRYNPFSEQQGKESSQEVINRNMELIVSHFPSSKIISRVGYDVKASCGMFVGAKE